MIDDFLFLVSTCTKCQCSRNNEGSDNEIYSVNRVFSRQAEHYSNTLVSLFSSPGTVIMDHYTESFIIVACLEGFLYGKISLLCPLTCTLCYRSPIILGIYSGIFAMYLQCPSKKSRTASILFYAVCLLYVLTTVTFVGDLVSCILDVSNISSIFKNIIFLN